MDSLEVLQQINILSSAILSNFNHITLKEYIDKYYIPFQKNAKTGANFKHILGQLNIISGYEFTDMTINTISENDIINFFNLLKKDRGIKQATINRYRSLLNHIFNTAIKDKVVNHNPVKYIKRYKEKSRDRVLNSNEIKALLQACSDSRNQELYYIVLVAIYTGMRYSNIVNMKKSNISGNVIYTGMRYSNIVNMKKSNISGNVYQLDGSETKSGKSQLIYLHQDLLNELNKYIKKYNTGDYFFKSKYISGSFKSACNKAGIDNFRFHDLRRTFATTLLYSDVNIFTISNMLGHSSLLMTQKYLANDSKKELDAINKLCFI